MSNIFPLEINAKLLAKSFPFLSRSPPLLYINQNLALPSLCKALHKDGWGYDFNEDTMNIGGEDVYISFLCAKDGERLRVIDSVETIKQAMGGLS